MTMDYAGSAEYILNNLNVLHKFFYDENVFSGPSYYFHIKALNSNVYDSDFSEAIYAMLTSWGMHRMGPKGAKMKEFEIFEKSIQAVKDLVVRMQNYSIYDMDEDAWNDMSAVFNRIDAMKTRIILVANSKAMAHMMPGVVAPIDRSYTIKYLRGSNSTYVPEGCDNQWELFKSIHTEYYYKIYKDKRFKQQNEKWSIDTDNKYKLDTSPLKTIDNLTIAAMRMKGKQY